MPSTGRVSMPTVHTFQVTRSSFSNSTSRPASQNLHAPPNFPASSVVSDDESDTSDRSRLREGENLYSESEVEMYATPPPPPEFDYHPREALGMDDIDESEDDTMDTDPDYDSVELVSDSDEMESGTEGSDGDFDDDDDDDDEGRDELSEDETIRGGAMSTAGDDDVSAADGSVEPEQTHARVVLVVSDDEAADNEWSHANYDVGLVPQHRGPGVQGSQRENAIAFDELVNSTEADAYDADDESTSTRRRADDQATGAGRRAPVVHVDSDGEEYSFVLSARLRRALERWVNSPD